jgi:hypothetical protein
LGNIVMCRIVRDMSMCDIEKGKHIDKHSA